MSRIIYIMGNRKCVLYSEIKAQAIMAGLDILWQFPAERHIVQVHMHVRQNRAPRRNPRNPFQGLVQMCV